MLLLLVACGTPLRTCVTDALAPMRPHQQHRLRHIFTGAPLLPKTRTVPFSSATAPSTAAADAAAVVAAVSDVEQSVARLKKVLEREYITFFNPMERDYYADSVTFDDPLTNLAGLEAYQANVDMLAGRTWLGALLFKDARIQLHSVTGGRVRTTPDSAEVVVEPVTTRWTLRFTFRALPWSPTASFSGISEYTVVPGGRQGVLITQQADYWDSINLQPVAVSAAVAAKEDGSTTSSSAAAAPSSDYQSVDRSVALQHFLGQLRPGHFQAVTAGPELPYTTLRLGRGYEVRRYPTYTAVQLTSYTRRDEAFLALGSFTARAYIYLSFVSLA